MVYLVNPISIYTARSEEGFVLTQLSQNWVFYIPKLILADA
jgi:hypothetical protein